MDVLKKIGLGGGKKDRHKGLADKVSSTVQLMAFVLLANFGHFLHMTENLDVMSLQTVLR